MFSHCANLEELKREYRTLCAKLHPDRGGDAQQFNAMHKEYLAQKKKLEQFCGVGACSECKGYGKVEKGSGLYKIELICPQCMGTGEG